MSNRVRATLPVSSTVIGVALSAAFMAVACGPGEARGTDGPGGEGKGGANRAPTVAKRIIAIAPNAAETICALGACDRIVGVSKYCVYPPELKERPRVGGLLDTDLERVAALRPDLLVMRGHNDPLEQLCRQLGVHVYRDETDSLDGIEVSIRELGRLVGRADRAEQLVAEFRARIEAIRRRTADLPKPRVFLTVMRQPDRLANLLTAGKGTFLDEMITVAGGKNVFGHLDMAYPQVSPEGVLARRPDVIIELLPELTLTPALEERLRSQWRSLGAIPAVGSGRIYFLGDDHSLIPSVRYPAIIEKVSRMLHPDGLSDP